MEDYFFHNHGCIFSGNLQNAHSILIKESSGTLRVKSIKIGNFKTGMEK